MQDNIILQRFRKFKAMIISADVPSAILLEMAENYMTSNDDDNTVAENIPVLDGQMSLLDYEFCA